MTPTERALLIAVASTLLAIARNPVAMVPTPDLASALRAIELESSNGLAPLHPEPAAAVLRRAEEALLLQVSGTLRAPLEYGTDDA